MWRQTHRWPALVLGLLLIFLSCTGSILAIEPVLARFDRHVMPLGDMTVGDVLRLNADKNPHFSLDRIRIDFSGRVMLRGADGGGAREVPVNLETGRLARVEQPNPFMDLIRRLHRNLNVGPQGRWVTLTASTAMVLLTISGLFLLVRRLGGWAQVFMPLKGRGLDKWHSWAGRMLVIPLFVIVFSGTWMALVSNKVVPSGIDHAPVYPETLVQADPVSALDLAVFDTVRLDSLTSLAFPIASDWWDVYVLRQGGSFTFIDRQTGDILSVEPVSIWVRLLDLFTLLHTGQGAAPWAAMAGLVALSVPFFTITGVVVGLRRRHPRPRGMVRPGLADVAIVVGSETGTTWGFAGHLAARLRDLGQKAYLGPMEARLTLRPDATLLLLAATYGDGAPPATAATFIDKLPGLTGASHFAVLGFGDKSFHAYCAFAVACNAALNATPRTGLLPMGDVNRRSAQSFATWGRDLGSALGLELTLDYVPPRPKTRALILTERQDFQPAPGANGSPAAILRFSAKRLPRFAAGDLLAILPPSDPVARLYSLASSAKEGFVELCVARVEGGACSTYLTGLRPGDSIDCYVTPNPDFRAARRKPTIMIGAGTGIAPFAGMIRGNAKNGQAVPMDLFFGLRHPDHDFYYRDAIADWQQDGRLHRFHPAFSRHEGRVYVQDRLRHATAHLTARLRAGATVMVCGSTQMAQAVALEIDTIAQSLGTSVSELRKRGRYLEDIY